MQIKFIVSGKMAVITAIGNANRKKWIDFFKEKWKASSTDSLNGNEIFSWFCFDSVSRLFVSVSIDDDVSGLKIAVLLNFVSNLVLNDANWAQQTIQEVI